MKKLLFFILFYSIQFYGQFNFNFDINTSGRRVCLAEATISSSTPSITIHLLENVFNNIEPFVISRRSINESALQWNVVANVNNVTSWTDTNVVVGQAYEYQIKRITQIGNATSYITACVNYDQTNYKGRLIFVVDNSFQTSLQTEINTYIEDQTLNGWKVETIFVPRATNWTTDATILSIKQSIQTIYNAAPTNDKPTHLFLFGHIPIARSGLNELAPDEHDENKGARGADCFYADLDGIFTDTQTYNPGTIDSKAINLPGDLKWDQDYIPSELELAFGRVDFADISGASENEEQLLRNYLTKLHNYSIVATGFDMGEKTAFNFGYDNSNDGSYRSLIPISKATNVDFYSGTLAFPQWVSTNGPYQIFMQNIQIPSTSEWQNNGMDATIFSSDQSYWGFWDEPYVFGAYGIIRELLSINTKCLGIIYTTTGINIFHQPGMGETMGWSCKRIMDHSLTNNLYEKQAQQYDTPEYWNRTHFQYHGDPTVKLFQVKPASNVNAFIDSQNNVFTCYWNPSTETGIIGYHLYKTTALNEPLTKITTNLITTTNVSLPINTINVGEFIVVRAVKLQETGSGTFLNPSIGSYATVEDLLTNNSFEKLITIYPNPTKDIINIQSIFEIESYKIFTLDGKLVASNKILNNSINLEQLQNGIYMLELEKENQKINVKIIKE